MRQTFDETTDPSFGAKHLPLLRAKMAELRQLERSLARFVQDCDQECAGGPAAQCCIFEDLRKGQAKATASCC